MIEGVLNAYLQSPYYQHFCGRVYFEHSLPIDPSSLVRWRKRLGEEQMEWLLTKSIQAAVKVELVQEKSFEEVIVDTTMMEKAITYPTDSKLLEKARERLVKVAQAQGMVFRQNYNRIGPRQALQEVLNLAERLYAQQRKDKNKLYSLHAPEVECISKGKSRQPYEFGVKASIAVTHKEGLVVGMRTMPGNPYDGHTLAEAIEQSEILTDSRIKRVYVDRGYRGHGVQTCEVLISGQKRGMSPSLKKKLKRRSAIEPTIGHMKTEGRLGRNSLKGALGDAMHALLCAAGHNLRLILNHLRDLFVFFWAWMQRLEREQEHRLRNQLNWLTA